VSLPLGKHEGQTLEFKRAEALRRPHGIARAVVAMLNASGGTIWIGVIEEGGRAVAIDPVERPREQLTRLRNHLLDTIDPALTEGPREDLRLEVLSAEGDESVLRLEVSRGCKRPYAQLKDGGRFYHLRVGDRLRAMTHEEIVDGGRSPLRPDPEAAARAELGKEREALATLPKGTLWIRLQPAFSTEILLSPSLRGLLTNPGASGNRESGWSVVNPHSLPKLAKGVLTIEQEYFGRTRVHRDGSIDYQAPVERLWHESPGGPKDQIYPFALVELPVSLLRLAARVHESNSRDDGEAFLLDMALANARGWKLRGYSPASYGYLFGHDEKEIDTDLLTIDRPVRVTRGELHDNPDRCALRLIQRLYESFGFEEDRIPAEFDRATGEFRLGS
jgi:hypothetical protein